MKARVQVNKITPCLLYYALQQEQKEALLQALNSMSIPAKEVTPGQLHQTVGHLAGFAGFLNSEGSAEDNSPTPCICMCGFAHGQMNLLLDTLRRQGVLIPLKAMATPTNQRWSFFKLMEELKAERREIAKKAKK